jgi:hypothetical protein
LRDLRNLGGDYMKVTVKALLIGAAVLLAACTGTTEPASEIKTASARLNARGTANAGAAYSYFQYWKSSTPGERRQTITRQWHAGASGPFGETVTALTPNTSYSFRACGNDAGKAAVCAQERTFKTAPDRDSVEALFDLACCYAKQTPRRIEVSAFSGPAGESPSGKVIENGVSHPVTCLKVDQAGGYPRAAIGYAGGMLWFTESQFASGGGDCNSPVVPTSGWTSSIPPIITVGAIIVDAQ